MKFFVVWGKGESRKREVEYVNKWNRMRLQGPDEAREDWNVPEERSS